MAWLLQVSKAYFGLLDVLCHSHQSAIASCDTATFAFLVSSLDAGLKSLDVSVSSQCAAAIDNLASYYLKHAIASDAPSPTAQVSFLPRLRVPHPQVLPLCRIRGL